MTVGELSLHVFLALLLQTAAFASLGLFRHWRVDQDLESNDMSNRDQGGWKPRRGAKTSALASARV